MKAMNAIKVFAAAFAAAALFVACTNTAAQDVDPTTVKNVEDLLPTAADVDSVSYLIGVQFGYFIKSNDFASQLSDLDMTQIRKGITDFLKAEGDPRDAEFNEQFAISPERMQELFGQFIQKRSDYKAENNRREGVKFLEQNKTKEGVVETESGLQYIITEAGNDVKPGPRDTVMVSYAGRLLNGEQFDASPEGEPIQMILNRVIPGWTEGLQLIGEGGKMTLFVPVELAYGSRGNRAIEPNSTLIFDVELAEVRPVAAAE